MNAAAVLVAATRQLADAGVPSPRVDAELLLAHLLGCPRSHLLTQPDIPAATGGDYDALVERRRSREPLQYIVGTVAFRHLELRVGAGVFIPRPETELLVDAVLAHLRSAARPVAVDLCAGSGALALAIADEVPSAAVVAVEAAQPAAEWLARNAAGAGVHVVVADVADQGLTGAGGVLAEFTGRTDAVVANPPYVPAATDVAAEVRHDPHRAVFAGPDGLALMPAVIARAAELLRPGGVLALEHDDTHASAVPGLLGADGRFAGIVDHRDLSGRPRYAVALRR